MMTRLLVCVAPVLALLIACAPPPSSPSEDARVESDGVAPMADAAVEASLPDVALSSDSAAPDAIADAAVVEELTIPSFSHPTAPGLCLPDPTALGTVSTQTPPTRGLLRFVTTTVMADDRVRPSYSEEFNGDSTINFVTPRAGRWRVTARGANLGLLSAYRGCTGSPTTATATLNGQGVTNELSLDLDSQRDERWFLTVDGCAPGRRCSVDLVAERIAPLSGCPVACATNEQCMLDPRDRERSLCYRSPTREELSSVTIRDFRFERDSVSTHAIITGVLSGGSSSEWNTTIPVFFTVNPPGFNLTGQHIGDIVVRRGRIVASPQTRIPAESRDVRLRLIGSDQNRYGYDQSQPPNGTTTITAWQRRTHGQPCDRADFAAMCAIDHVCREGVCQRVQAPTIVSLVAYREPTSQRLRANVEGVRVGAGPVGLQWELLSASGATLLQISRGASSSMSWMVQEESPFSVNVFEPLLPEMVRVATALRVTASQPGAPSHSVTVALRPTVTAAPGEACDWVARACGAGFVCERDACIPAAAPVCERQPFVSEWAPAAGDESVVSSSMSPTREASPPPCGSISHGNASVTTDFVAPATAEYTFEATSLPNGGSPVILDVMNWCSSETCSDGMAPTATRRLFAGQRVRLRAWFSGRYLGAQMRVRSAPWTP